MSIGPYFVSCSCFTLNKLIYQLSFRQILLCFKRLVNLCDVQEPLLKKSLKYGNIDILCSSTSKVFYRKVNLIYNTCKYILESYVIDQWLIRQRTPEKTSGLSQQPNNEGEIGRILASFFSWYLLIPF